MTETDAHSAILHTHLAGGPWDSAHTARLPGTVPLDPAHWLVVDEAYGAQMALRSRLIARQRDAVIGATAQAEGALAELYDLVLDRLSREDGFARDGDVMIRPDGGRVALVPRDPLATLGCLVAEDLCLLQRPEGAAEHVLTAAVLCFPSHWALDEKLGRPMMRIHAPVPRYDAGIGKRVQRMFDGLSPGRLLTRMNALPTDDFTLFTPQREGDAAPHGANDGPYLRSERQCLLKLPRSGAVVFSIQTRMIRRADLPTDQRAGLAAYLAAGGRG